MCSVSGGRGVASNCSEISQNSVDHEYLRGGLKPACSLRTAAVAAATGPITALIHLLENLPELQNTARRFGS